MLCENGTSKIGSNYLGNKELVGYYPRNRELG